MNPDKVLCNCKKVTKGDIVKAMKSGAKNFKEVSEATGAGTKCGKCKDDVKDFIKKQNDK